MCGLRVVSSPFTPTYATVNHNTKRGKPQWPLYILDGGCPVIPGPRHVRAIELVQQVIATVFLVNEKCCPMYSAMCQY